MLDILRIYMRIYYAHHRISGVCSEHMYMHIYQLCIYTIIIGVLQHAGYTCIYYIYTCVYIAYILRISGACFRTYVYGVCVCMCIIGFYNMLDILAYTAYILRISGACFRTWCVCVYISTIGCSAHAGYARYTAYIHAYILRTSSHIGRMLRTWCMCICGMYIGCSTTCWICSIYYIYTCVYIAYILRISGACLRT